VLSAYRPGAREVAYDAASGAVGKKKISRLVKRLSTVPWTCLTWRYEILIGRAAGKNWHVCGRFSMMRCWTGVFRERLGQPRSVLPPFCRCREGQPGRTFWTKEVWTAFPQETYPQSHGCHSNLHAEYSTALTCKVRAGILPPGHSNRIKRAAQSHHFPNLTLSRSFFDRGSTECFDSQILKSGGEAYVGGRGEAMAHQSFYAKLYP